MIITNTPRDLAIDIAKRSICKDRVGCVIEDSVGVFGWGWNHCGYGDGMCAERYAISRSNKSRLNGATIYVARFKPSGKIGIAYPCEKCLSRINKYGITSIWFTNRKGEWELL